MLSKRIEIASRALSLTVIHHPLVHERSYSLLLLLRTIFIHVTLITMHLLQAQIHNFVQFTKLQEL